MTNPTPHGQVPEALTHECDRAIMEGERNASLDAYSRVVLLTSAESRLYEAAFTNGWDRCAAHVQKPAKNEHVAGDVSKNGAELDTSQQPAPDYEAGWKDGYKHGAWSAQQPAPAVATPECLTCSDRGAVGNILTAEPCPDCTRLNAQQAPAAQQAGWKLVPMVPTAAMVDAGCPVGEMVDHFDMATAYRSMLAAAPQHSPTAQAAESVPKAQFDDPKVQAVYAILCEDAEPPKGEHWEGFAARRIVDALLADNVLEDAAASEVLMEHSGCGSGTQVDMLTVRLNPGDKVIMLKGRITQATDAARKQGANHD